MAVKDIYTRKTIIPTSSSIGTSRDSEAIKRIQQARGEKEQYRHYERQAVHIKNRVLSSIQTRITQKEQEIKNKQQRLERYEQERREERDDDRRDRLKDDIEEERDEINAIQKGLNILKGELSKYEKISDPLEIVGYGDGYGSEVLRYANDIEQYEEDKARVDRENDKRWREFKKSEEFKDIKNELGLKDNIQQWEYNRKVKEAYSTGIRTPDGKFYPTNNPDFVPTGYKKEDVLFIQKRMLDWNKEEIINKDGSVVVQLRSPDGSMIQPIARGHIIKEPEITTSYKNPLTGALISAKEAPLGYIPVLTKGGKEIFEIKSTIKPKEVKTFTDKVLDALENTQNILPWLKEQKNKLQDMIIQPYTKYQKGLMLGVLSQPTDIEMLNAFKQGNLTKDMIMSRQVGKISYAGLDPLSKVTMPALKVAYDLTPPENKAQFKKDFIENPQLMQEMAYNLALYAIPVYGQVSIGLDIIETSQRGITYAAKEIIDKGVKEGSGEVIDKAWQTATEFWTQKEAYETNENLIQDNKVELAEAKNLLGNDLYDQDQVKQNIAILENNIKELEKNINQINTQKWVNRAQAILIASLATKAGYNYLKNVKANRIYRAQVKSLEAVQKDVKRMNELSRANNVEVLSQNVPIKSVTFKGKLIKFLETKLKGTQIDFKNIKGATITTSVDKVTTPVWEVMKVKAGEAFTKFLKLPKNNVYYSAITKSKTYYVYKIAISVQDKTGRVKGVVYSFTSNKVLKNTNDILNKIKTNKFSLLSQRGKTDVYVTQDYKVIKDSLKATGTQRLFEVSPTAEGFEVVTRAKGKGFDLFDDFKSGFKSSPIVSKTKVKIDKIKTKPASFEVKSRGVIRKEGEIYDWAKQLFQGKGTITTSTGKVSTTINRGVIVDTSVLRAVLTKQIKYFEKMKNVKKLNKAKALYSDVQLNINPTVKVNPVLIKDLGLGKAVVTLEKVGQTAQVSDTLKASIGGVTSTTFLPETRTKTIKITPPKEADIFDVGFAKGILSLNKIDTKIASAEKTKQLELQKQKELELQKEKDMFGFAELFKTQQIQQQKVKQIQQQKQELKKIQRTQQGTQDIFQTITPAIIKPISPQPIQTKDIFNKNFRFFQPPITKPKKVKKPKEESIFDWGFVAEVRRKGKFKPVSKVVSKKEAYLIGQDIVKNTLGATFRVTKADKKIKQKKTEDSFFGISEDFYKKKTKEGELFIEKRKKRLSTKGERKEIQRAKKKKSPWSLW